MSQKMVKDALDAFVARDAFLAKDVMARDDAVDELTKKFIMNFWN